MLTTNNKTTLKQKGITEEQFNAQLERFSTGFPFLELVSAATLERGILSLSDVQKNDNVTTWNNYKNSAHNVMKFVPASGAASRMFKDLYAFVAASYTVPTTEFEIEFFTNLDKFAFYDSLNAVCISNELLSIGELMFESRYKDIVSNLLDERGLNYGSLPKGLLEFHKYINFTRTPAEEHLKEGSMYAMDSNSEVNIHFTVSTEHQTLFDELIRKKKLSLEQEIGVKYNITFSQQKANTDTIAADEFNHPFLDDGELLFRPGGHGALIENLNDLDADIIFVKNIDNVVPDSLKVVEVDYKQCLAGVLVSAQEKLFAYSRSLEEGVYSHEYLLEMLYFLQNDLCVKNPETKLLEDAELALYLKNKFDRPIRVCGMVKNLGEPGGGPFFVISHDGTIALQIMESSQIDTSVNINKEIVKNSTHFNPVDLVCGVRNWRGEKFDLLRYVDHDAGFISIKSKDGKELKALELPGLWNGAMSDWNTIFVEVPIDVFNPVKTVNDLLRSNHLE